MTFPLTRFADLVHLNTDRTADPLAVGVERVICAESGLPDFHALRQGLRSVPTTFATVVSLADIRSNDGNLSIPLYVLEKAVSEGKGEYSDDGLRDVVEKWKESSTELSNVIDGLLEMLT